MSSAETVAARPSSMNRRKITAYTLVAAATMTAVLYLVVDPVAGHRLEAVSGGATMHITVAWVVAGTIIPGACGLAIASLLRRLSNGRLVWLIVSSAALLLSLGGPFGGTTTVTVLVLLAMHLLVGAAVIPAGYFVARR